MTQILQEAVVTNGYVKLKFIDTIKLTSIVPEVFTLSTAAATPQAVSDPFDDFTIADNYNSLSRTLTLYWNSGKLQPLTDYTLTIDGLLDAASRPISDGTVNFTTSSSTEPDTTEVEPPELEPVEIEDHSILTGLDFSIVEEPEVTDDEFAVTSVDPSDGTFFLDQDYARGRVSITFTQRPSIEKVNSTYFKAHRKLVQRQPIRWESVDVHVSLDSTSPVVYVDFPSLDDEPVYYTTDSDYFEDGYKYRVVVSKGLST